MTGDQDGTAWPWHVRADPLCKTGRHGVPDDMDYALEPGSPTVSSISR